MMAIWVFVMFSFILYYIFSFKKHFKINDNISRMYIVKLSG